MTAPILVTTAAAATAPLTSALLKRAEAPIPVLPTAVLIVAGVAAVFARSLSGWWLPVPVVLTVVAAPLALADVRHLRLPDVLTLPAYPLLGAAVGAAALGGGGPSLAVRAAVGALLFGGVHALVRRAAPASLGAGDVKLSGSLGGVLGAAGWPHLALAAVLAAALSLVLAVARTVVGRARSAIARRSARTARRGPGARPASPPAARRSAPALRPASGLRPVPVAGRSAPRRSAPIARAPGDLATRLAGPALAQREPPALRLATGPRPTPAAHQRSSPHLRPAVTTPSGGHRVPHGPALLAATWLCALFPAAA